MDPVATEIAASEVKGGLVRVAIAYTGKFKQGDKEFSITDGDLTSMQANLKQREVPLDYEHLSASSGAPPGHARASGWLKSADEIEDFGAGRKVLWAWAEFTPSCLAAIRQKEYRYFSPEIHWNATDEANKAIGTRLAAGAITNRPFLKDLPPIEISATDYQPLLETASLSEHKRLMDTSSVHVTTAIKKEPTKMAKNLKLKKIEDGENKGKHGFFDGAEMVGLCDDAEMKSYMSANPFASDEDDAEKKKVAAVEAVRNADTACFTELAAAKPGEVITLAEKATESGKMSVQAFIKVQRIEKMLTEAQTAGKILPAHRSKYFKLALADSDSVSALLSEMKPVVDLKTRGIQGNEESTPADEAVAQDTEVRAYMSEKKTDMATALRAVAQKNPERYERVRNSGAVMTGKEARA